MSLTPHETGSRGRGAGHSRAPAEPAMPGPAGCAPFQGVGEATRK
ncbi:MAG: hypothetical protein OJF60_000749 [Burkholderiaceae bacterium]|nr:MAG: hypothetical protein OJF60_000749 [Burkholderiaceae bacterium]